MSSTSSRTVVALLALACVACQKPESRDPAAASVPVARPPQPTTPAPAPPTPAPADRHRGMLVLTPEMRFTPCHESDAIRVMDGTAGQMLAVVNELAPGGESVFAELRGRRSPAGVMATRLLAASPGGEGNPCSRLLAPGVVEARGNEPFWAVSVTPTSITWQEPELLAPLVFASASASTSNGNRVWTAVDGERFIRVEISAAECRDSMSGAFSLLSAAVTLDDRSFTGCANEGS